MRIANRAAQPASRCRASTKGGQPLQIASGKGAARRKRRQLKRLYTPALVQQVRPAEGNAMQLQQTDGAVTLKIFCRSWAIFALVLLPLARITAGLYGSQIHAGLRPAPAAGEDAAVASPAPATAGPSGAASEDDAVLEPIFQPGAPRTRQSRPTLDQAVFEARATAVRKDDPSLQQSDSALASLRQTRGKEPVAAPALAELKAFLHILLSDPSMWT